MPQSAQEVFLVAVEISGAAVLSREHDLWETVRMSEKRTKADKAQRQAGQLEKKASRRPAQTRKTFLDPAQVENAIVCPRLRFLAAVTDGKEQQVSRRIGQEEVLSSLSGSRSQSGTKEHR